MPFLLWWILALSQLPDESRPASISGRVVDAVTGRPIAGVIVTPAGPAVQLTPAAPLPPRALTNGQGEFVLRGLRRGTAFFTAVKSGYVNATYNQRRPGGSGQGVPLGNGADVRDLQIRMWRHAAISGTIVDESGEPAVGVRVQAFAGEYVAGRKQFIRAAIATTDDRGVYRIANLTPGDYTVGMISTVHAVPTEIMDVFYGAAGGGTPEQRARLAGELNAIGSAVVPAGTPFAIAVGDQTVTLPSGTLVPQAGRQRGLMIYPTTFYPASTTLAHAGVLTLRSGEERASVDLQLIPARTARVSGTVIAPDGPASNVGVRLVPADTDDVVSLLDAATTVTSGAGVFSFPAVPPGEYVIRVLRPPREPLDLNSGPGVRVTPGGAITLGTAVPPATTTPPPPPPVPADATLYARVGLAVGEGDISDLVVPLAAAPRVSGRVEFEGFADKPNAATLAGIRINLDPAGGGRLPDGSIAFQAGHPEEDGSFRTYGVPPGKYVLRVNPPAGWFLRGAFAAGVDISDTPVELTTRDLTGIVIAFTDRPASVAGIVREGMTADPAAVVLAFPTDSALWSSHGAYARRMRTARADREGMYAINGLPAGEYHIVAVHEEEFGDWQDPNVLERFARVARRIQISDGERRSEDLSTALIRR